MLAKEVDVDAKDNDGRTALMFASRNVHGGVVKELIAHGADVNARDNDKKTALMLVSNEDPGWFLKGLIDHSADINLKDKDGLTALMLASRGGCYDNVKVLLSVNGVDINAKDNNGSTALMWAKEEGHTEIMRMIQEAAEYPLIWHAEKCNIERKGNGAPDTSDDGAGSSSGSGANEKGVKYMFDCIKKRSKI